MDWPLQECEIKLVDLNLTMFSSQATILQIATKACGLLLEVFLTSIPDDPAIRNLSF